MGRAVRRGRGIWGRSAVVAVTAVGVLAGHVHEPAARGRVTCLAPWARNRAPSADGGDRDGAKSFVTYGSWRWGETATDGYTGLQGSPVTLTWSLVPDGTLVPSSRHGAAGNSDLVAFLDRMYGPRERWFPLLEQTFARWTDASGIRFVHEPADDGAELGSARGVLGVRGDIRLSGQALDPDGSALAYADYPDDGDVVFDTDNDYYRNRKRRWLRFRNVLAHEIGHALGLGHVCPDDGTKLMERYGSCAYDGPQYDEVRGARFLYGDALEGNDGAARATPLNVASGSARVRDAAISWSGDRDTYAIDVPPGSFANVRVRPRGRRYPVAPVTEDRCDGPFERADTRAARALSVAVLDADGHTVLGISPAIPRGETVALRDVQLAPGGGVQFVEVSGDLSDAVQEYDLSVRLARRGDKPRPEPDAAATWTALPVPIDVLANDAGLSDTPVRVSVETPPTYGTVRRSGSALVYVPDRGGVPYLDRLVYRVTDRDGQWATAAVALHVRDSVRAGHSRVDSDGDGYPDELETWLGTAPDDASAAPGADASGGGRAIAITDLRLSLDARRQGNDSVTLRGTLLLFSDPAPGRTFVHVSVGGVQRSYELGSDGGSRDAPEEAFRLDRAPPGVPTPFELRIRSADLAAQLTDEGLTADATHGWEPRAITVLLLIGGRLHEASVPLDHRAHRGGRAKARPAR